MLTNEELNIIVQIFDIATKAGGLQVAQQALPLLAKLQELGKANGQVSELDINPS